jgi:hypothetical protein
MVKINTQLTRQNTNSEKITLHGFLTYCIAAVWVVNGLFCKVLGLVHRHEQIVAEILGSAYSRPLTLLIGLSEIGMAVWVLSRIKTRLNAIAQITIVASMNLLEFVLVPDLLLWGRMNSVFALLFILVVYYNEFVLNRTLATQS